MEVGACGCEVGAEGTEDVGRVLFGVEEGFGGEGAFFVAREESALVFYVEDYTVFFGVALEISKGE